MHFFVWLLAALLIVLVLGLVLGVIYLSSSAVDLNAITVQKAHTVFTNGTDVIWKSEGALIPPILLKDGPLTGFFVDASWALSSLTGNLDDPLYFTILPDVALTARSFIVHHSSNFFPPGYDNLVAEVYGTAGIAFKLATGNVASPNYLTGRDLTLNAFQEFGVVIAYTVA